TSARIAAIRRCSGTSKISKPFPRRFTTASSRLKSRPFRPGAGTNRDRKGGGYRKSGTPRGLAPAWGTRGDFFLMAQDFDLLGDPIPKGFGKRGRPPHVPNDEKRKLVMMLQALDWSD